MKTQDTEHTELQQLHDVSAHKLIKTFNYKPTVDEEEFLLELVEMALHKRQVAEMLANIYDANYTCDIAYCMRYTNNIGGALLLKAFFWLFKAIKKSSIEDVLSKEFIFHIIKLHSLKPKS